MRALATLSLHSQADRLPCAAAEVAADMRVLRAIATASDDTVATTELPAEGRPRSPRQNPLPPVATATTDTSQDSMLHLNTSTEAALAEEREWADSFQSFLSSVSAHSSQPDSPGASSVNGRLVRHSLFKKHLLFRVHHTGYQHRPSSGGSKSCRGSNAHLSTITLQDTSICSDGSQVFALCFPDELSCSG